MVNGARKVAQLAVGEDVGKALVAQRDLDIDGAQCRERLVERFLQILARQLETIFGLCRRTKKIKKA